MADDLDEDDYGGSDYSDDFDNVSLDDYEFDDVPDLPTDAGLHGFEKDNEDTRDDDKENDGGEYVDYDDEEDDGNNKIFPETGSAEDIVMDVRIGDAAFQSVATTKDVKSVIIADSAFQACSEEGNEQSQEGHKDGVQSKWGREFSEFDHLVSKCIENEKRRLRESSLITSVIAKDCKHRRAIVERQLAVAINQINSYRKENAYLTHKIDSSMLYAELERNRSEIQNQAARIKELQEENRSLDRMRRFQEKSFVEMEREQEKPGKEEARVRQKKLVESKIKSLKNQLISYQARDRLQYKENLELKEKNMKLNIKIQAIALTQSVAQEMRGGGGGSVGVGEAGMSMDLPSVHMSDDLCGGSVLSVDDGSLEHLQSENNRLKSIVNSQRSSFRQQLTGLQGKLERSMKKRRELEEELSNREKDMKVQVSLSLSWRGNHNEAREVILYLHLII
jgi:hypothetical protein